ncbi:YycH family regulatory protein [Pilibacter termitis]|uniref:YycH family regulatory protein n=1 Tax=Pilibacter termitis TaxID=263852 RepID=UPI0013566AC4|nr:two-component system activity regulator YycH [Pilibacter termitis]
MSKLTERISQALLIVLIVISLVLSYFIWFNPEKSLTDETISENLKDENSILSEKTVFLPIYLISRTDGKMRWIQGENVLSDAQKILSNVKFGKIKFHKATNDDFQKTMNVENGLELRYEDKFLFGEYQEAFNLKIKKISDSEQSFWFRRVLVNFSNGMVYFVNDETKQYIEVAGNINQKSFESLIQSKELKSLPVSENHEILGVRYAIDEQIELKKYSYIVASQPYTVFRDAFFQNVKHTTFDVEVPYVNDSNENFDVKETNGQLSFQGFIGTERSENEIEGSFQYVQNLGNIFPQLRFFAKEEKGTIYRTFVEGYPVFSQIDQGKVIVSFGLETGEGRTITLRSNVDTLQVPIPTNEMIRLPKTMDVIKQLQNAGAKQSEIKSLVIGYSWGELNKNNSIVDLLPNWFIHYKQEWLPLSVLLENLQKGEK